MTLRKVLCTGAAVAAMATAAIAATAGPAQADNGDGAVACNSGEICFWRYNGAVLWTKQFWRAADHAGYTWYAGGTTSVRVQDDAVDVTNKDTECRVRVGNYLGNGNWSWDYIPNDYLRKDLVNAHNKNDYHDRCN